MWHSRQRNKYGAKRASFNGRVYHSQMERDDAMWLHQLEKSGELQDLKEQVHHRIFVNGVHITDAIVDFQFRINGVVVWYETKGFRTERYRLLAKLIPATLPEGEMYIVNPLDLQNYLRGRLR